MNKARETRERHTDKFHNLLLPYYYLTERYLADSFVKIAAWPLRLAVSNVVNQLRMAL